MSSHRRIYHILLVCVWLCGCVLLAGCREEEQKPAQPAPSVEKVEGVIVAMGDSLTAGLGVDEVQAYPALLEEKLKTAGRNYRVVNGGVSGETSSGTLNRVDWIMTLNPDIVILETGANDGLRATDTGLLEKNLHEIITRFKEQGVIVVFAGMKMVWNLGEEYTAAFNEVYPRVASLYDLPFMPFFLEGVAADPAMNLDDGLHPNPEGYKKITEEIFPYVMEAVTRLEHKREAESE